jgi:large subunit ribosomal protein L10e
MVKKRKFCAYRKLEARPYTRVSRYRNKAYIKITPVINVVRFNMGDANGEFGYTLNLLSKIDCQIRHNALESARMTSNRLLENNLGKKGYFLRIRAYPFHIMRENPLASGAGADRMSTGMAHPFGNPIGSAARILKGKVIMEIKVNKANLELAKKAIKRAAHKLPCACQVVIVENKKGTAVA